MLPVPPAVCTTLPQLASFWSPLLKLVIRCSTDGPSKVQKCPLPPPSALSSMSVKVANPLDSSR
jgi:hypothetical protein